MKALILSVNDNILNNLAPNTCANFLAGLLFQKNVEVAGNYIIPVNKETLESTLQNLSSDINTIIILGDVDAEINLKIKQMLAKYLSLELALDEQALESIRQYYKNRNLPMEQSAQNEAMLLKDSHLIENTYMFYQGFATFQGGRHFLFLPSHLESLKAMYDNWFVNYIESKFTRSSLTRSLKTFGLSVQEANKLLGDLFKNKNQIKILLYPNDLELLVLIKYSPLSPKEDVDAFFENVKERLKNVTYTSDDKSIYEVAYALMQQTNTRLSIAESVTGGLISANLIQHNPNISEHLLEGIVCYTDESKTNRLKVEPSILEKYSSVSAETAYEMAAGMLETNQNANMVLATCGYAGQKGESTGLVFIAVGDYDGIHIYKNKFSGSRKKIIEQTSKAALFYLIKKLKQKVNF